MRRRPTRSPDHADDPEIALAKKDKAAVLRQCLLKLSAEHREIVNLVYYQHKSVEEVAGIVGIPEATVKTRMFYARKKLSELLDRARHRTRLAMTDGKQHDRRTPGEPSEIELLLPWYAAGTLDPDEMRQVEAALASDPELASRYEWVRAEFAQETAIGDAAGEPSPGDVRTLFAKIDALPARRSQTRPQVSAPASPNF